MSEKFQEELEVILHEVERSKEASVPPCSFNYSTGTDQIFKRLCDKSQFQKSNSCQLCKKTTGLLSSLKNCKFCGCSVCEDCSPKRRADPCDRNSFQRICDLCEEKYLRVYLAGQFKVRKDLLSEKISDIQGENDSYKSVLNVKTQEYTAFSREMEDIEQEASKDEAQLQKKRIALENSMKANEDTNEELEKIHSQKQAVEEDISEKLTEIQRTSVRVEQLNSDIERLTDKQKTLSDELASINQNVTSYQLNNRKGMDSILHTQVKSRRNQPQKSQMNRNFSSNNKNNITKDSALTNGYDDVFRSTNNNADSVENYLIGLPSQSIKNQASFDYSR